MIILKHIDGGFSRDAIGSISQYVGRTTEIGNLNVGNYQSNQTNGLRSVSAQIKKLCTSGTNSQFMRPIDRECAIGIGDISLELVHCSYNTSQRARYCDIAYNVCVDDIDATFQILHIMIFGSNDV